jgi:hypothetical protein
MTPIGRTPSCWARAPATLAVVLTLGLLLVPSSVAAHENRPVYRGTLELGPGEGVSLGADLHYHRFVGRVRVVGDGIGEVRLDLIGGDGRTIERLGGPGAEFVLNRLVRCCKGAAWSPFAVRLENPGASPIRVEVDLVLLHDGVAVLTDDAEPGAAATALFWFVLFSGVFGYRLWRRTPGEGRSTIWARRAAFGHLAMWAGAGALGVVGMLRYGGGPVAGNIAVAADLPWIPGPILTTQDLFLGACIGLWAFSVGAWSRAARIAPEDRSVARLGILLGGGAILAAGIWAVEYGSWVVPALVAVGSSALPLLGGILILRRAQPSGRYGLPSSHLASSAPD